MHTNTVLVDVLLHSLCTHTKKNQVLVDFLSIGCSVLLTDVDVIWVTDPFLNGLYRDSDVEGMSDGWDEVISIIIV